MKNPDGTPLGDSLDDNAMASVSEDLDAEYFNWKEEEGEAADAPKDDKKKKGRFGSFFSK